MYPVKEPPQDKARTELTESMETFSVAVPGSMTTVQDLGRVGYQWLGMPLSGALDAYAFSMGNVLLGQDRNVAGLEISFLGPKLDVLQDTEVVFTGADVHPQVNQRRIPMWTVVSVREGDRLSCRVPVAGCRSYLGVRGGIDVPEIMGSRSTNVRLKLGGLQGRPLIAGDRICSFRSGKRRDGATLPDEFIPEYGSKAEVRVILGPQEDYFHKGVIRTFLNSTYKLTPDVNREGFRLDGPAVVIGEESPKSIPSEAIPPGGIQIRPNGQPLIIMNDLSGGGYVKIATVISTDLPKIVQLRPGDTITFKAVKLEEAHFLYRKAEEEIRQLQISQANKSP